MRPILKLVFFFSSLLTLSSLSAQTTDSSLAELAEKWQHAKTYTLQMAKEMPEEFYDFKPVPEEMTFGEQLLHMAQNIYVLSALITGTKSSFVKPAHPAKAETIAIVGAAYDTGLATHTRLIASNLGEKVAFFAGPKTKRQVLVILHDHQTHHAGQLIVYLRLKGMEPPDYIGW